MRFSHLRLWRLTIAAVVSVTVVFAFWRLHATENPHISQRVDGSALRACPDSLAVLLPMRLHPAAIRAVEAFSATPPTTASDYFHKWRFDACRGAYRLNQQLRLDMGRLLKREEYQKLFPLSRSLFFRSPFGLEVRQRRPERGRSATEYEYHLDQFLASCAEVEAPLNLSIDTDSGAATLGDLLDASRRNFDQSQELNWTLVAYCAYLPNEPQWRNRFGDLCSYERIVSEVLSRPLAQGSCGGTHKQYALAFFLSRSAAMDSFTPCLRVSCENYLKRSSAVLQKSQLPNGAWSSSWADATDTAAPERRPSTLTVDELVRVTGHHLEWICLAPPSVRPSDPSVSAAVRFLVSALERADLPRIKNDYCAYSHAACVLARLTSWGLIAPHRNWAISGPEQDVAVRATGLSSKPPRDRQ